MPLLSPVFPGIVVFGLFLFNSNQRQVSNSTFICT